MSDQTVTVLATRDPNCILVQHHASGISLLVDFAWTSEQVDTLETMLARLGTSADAIDAVLLTHLHGDHFREAGLREFLRRRSPAAPKLPLWRHRDEPVPDPVDMTGFDVRRFDESPFEITGYGGTLTVVPVRMTHTPGTCGFRIGDDYLGCDSSLAEVFSKRVLSVLNPSDGGPVRGLFIDMQALDRETVMKSDVTDERKRNMLKWHGLVSEMVAIMGRPDLREFFGGLERLVCLHVTPGVNDPTGLTNARLISETRDRLAFTFDVPVVPTGIQNV